MQREKNILMGKYTHSKPDGDSVPPNGGVSRADTIRDL